MKTQASWQRELDALQGAKILAEFANLESDGAERFKKHLDFVPQLWWTPAWNKELGTYATWMRERDLLRKAWAAGFPADKTLELATTNVFLAARVALASDTAEEPDNAPQKIWPYQKAILFLHVNAWRAQACEWCKKRFIAKHPKARFCSFGVVVDGNETTCFWAHRKKYKNEKWIENRDSINKQRRQEYQLEQRSQRSRRAKRKSLRQR